MKKIFTLCFMFCTGCLSAQIPKIQLVSFATGITKPVDIKHCGDNRLFVVEQAGRIRIVRPNGAVDATAFLDITSIVLSAGNEQGLLSLAFSPNYKTDGYFFVNYITGTSAGSSVIARYSVNPADSNAALPLSEVKLLQFTQPYTNHNGCDLRFGPDGYLYATFGDGGSQNDPNANGQNTNVYFGKVLRIDPFGAAPYAIPPTNPFYGQVGKKQEIWAYGLRNPWRCSFDRLTGDYWIGDVGQGTIEEIDFHSGDSLGGQNYGWRCYEGSNAFNTSGCSTIPTDFVYPVYEYTHSASNGCSVTGGYVYRGPQYSKMFGKYIFADYCSGRILCTQKIGPAFTTSVVGTYTTYQYSSFGENSQGDLFVTGLGANRIYKITDTSSCKPVAFLSFKDTIFGCDNSYTLNTLYGTGLTYSWSYNGTPIAAANSYTYSASQQGKYVVSVTYTGTCTSTDTVVLQLNKKTPVNITGLGNFYCVASPTVTLTANVSGGTFTINDTIPATVFSPSQLGAGSYTVQYTYVNSFNCTTTDTVHVTVSLCTDVENSGSLQGFAEIFPNPGIGIFSVNVHSGSAQSLNATVYNILGTQVYATSWQVKTGKQRMQLDLEELSEGMYFLKLEGSDMNKTLRVNIKK